jgi:hypothetical protein
MNRRDSDCSRRLRGSHLSGLTERRATRYALVLACVPSNPGAAWCATRGWLDQEWRWHARIRPSLGHAGVEGQRLAMMYDL